MSTNSSIHPLPMVSVIVPVYNAEKYVEECIKSILNQDYSNIELIIVNDGSTDNSYETCKMISEKDERIRLYDRNNCGVGKTRNFGIEKARGKYITFVDADDFLDKNMICRMVDEAEENDAEVVVAGFRRVTEAGEVVHEESYEEKIIDDVKNEFAPRLIGSRPECRDSIFATVWGKLYLHKCFSESLVRFNDSRTYEDLMFLLDFMPEINRVALISDVLYNYRENAGCVTSQYDDKAFETLLKVYDDVANRVEKYDFPSDSIYRIHKFLFVHLRVLIGREKVKMPHKKKKDCIENIRLMISHETVCAAVKQYPIQKLNIKQKVFVYLLKLKMARMLYYLC